MVDGSSLSQSGQERWRVVAAGPTLSYEVVSADVRQSTVLTLLCLHGNSSHRGIWRPVSERLAEHRRVLVDLRGFGDSDHVSPPAYDPEHHAADIAAIVGAGLIRPPYAILAHSAGALAATYFIAKDTTGTAMPEALVWVDLDPLVPRWQVDYFHKGASSVARTFGTVEDAARPLRRIYPKIPEDRLQAFVADGLRPVEGGFRMKLDPATYETWEPGDLRPFLPAVRCPTLVLRGCESIVTSAEGVEALKSGLPDHEAVEIPGGSHMLLLEQPDTAAEAIRDFLRRRVLGGR
jgi:pimeloyl-ACP methyl ester carboxylesterase